jgi:signal peptidase I
MARVLVRRRTWIAVLLALLDVVLGMLYIGRWRWAVFYFCLGLVLGAVVWLSNTSDDLLSIPAMAYVIDVAVIKVVVAVHVYWLNRGSPELESRWYSRWQFLAFYIFAPMIVAVTVRTFLVHSYELGARSMAPTLMAEDKVFAAKHAYGVGPYSPPFGPYAFLVRSSDNVPEYGDVVVTRVPKVKSTYVKRVVGLPGDRIQMVDGILHINGAPIARKQVEDYVLSDKDGRSSNVPQFVETLPNGATYRVIERLENGPSDNTDIFQLDDDEIYVLGDNRDSSLDSRMEKFGTITIQELEGRVDRVFFDGPAGALTWRVVGPSRDQLPD